MPILWWLDIEARDLEAQGRIGEALSVTREMVSSLWPSGESRSTVPRPTKARTIMDSIDALIGALTGSDSDMVTVDVGGGKAVSIPRKRLLRALEVAQRSNNLANGLVQSLTKKDP